MVLQPNIIEMKTKILYFNVLYFNIQCNLMYLKNETWLDSNENLTIDSWNMTRMTKLDIQLVQEK